MLLADAIEACESLGDLLDYGGGEDKRGLSGLVKGVV